MPESCRSFGSAAKRGELQKQLEINHLEQGQGVVNNAILFVARRQNYSENCYSPFSGRDLTSENKDVSIKILNMSRDLGLRDGARRFYSCLSCVGEDMRNDMLLCTVGLAVSLASCANLNSIHRPDELRSEPSLTFIDAKQRAIIKNNSKICTEPPPDVFSVYAQSLAASGSVSKGTDPTTLGVSGSFGQSSSEMGSTIARTQAYNLMALQLYYNCLSSLNKDSGALDAPIDRVRLQRMIVSTMAIEQLTGSIQPKVVVIGTGGSGSAGGSTEAMATLAKARQEDQTAKTNLKNAEDAKTKLEAEDPKCSALVAKVKAGTALSAGAEQTKSENCTKADANVAATKRASDETGEYYKAQLASSGNGLSATVDTKQIEAKVIEVASQRDPATVQKVADAVKEIVLKNVEDQDETKFFCMRLLYDPEFRKAAQAAAPGGATNLGQGCAALLLSNVRAGMDAQTRATYEAEFSAAAQQILLGATTNFDAYWSNVITNGKLDSGLVAKKLDPLIATAGIPATTMNRLRALKAAQDIDATRAAFSLLPSDLQQKLAQ